MPETTTATQAPAQLAMTPAATTSPRRIDFAAACATLAAAYRETRSLTAALNDIIPANDAGGAVMRPQWLDEVWTPVAAGRWFIEAINRQNLSSGLKVYGWKWDVFPTVGPYAGNKTDVPSSPVSTEPIEATVEQLAAGWDVARIMVDLGDPSFVEAIFQAAVRDLAAKQETDVTTTLLAAATADGTAATSAWDAITTAAVALAQRGAAMTFCGLAPDLWADYVMTPTATVPWSVPNGSDPNLTEQRGNFANVPFFMAPALPAGTLLAGDRRAATFFEPSPNPIRVNAVNIPQGGVDLGVFGYHAILVNDARGLSKVTKTATP